MAANYSRNEDIHCAPARRYFRWVSSLGLAERLHRYNRIVSAPGCINQSWAEDPAVSVSFDTRNFAQEPPRFDLKMIVKPQLPPGQRRAFGQSRRKQVRRQEQKRWLAADRQTDPIDTLAASTSGRVLALLDLFPVNFSHSCIAMTP
jgi:hypothetical protein